MHKKHFILLTITAFFQSLLIAQTNTLVISIDEEEKFSIFINDVRQNVDPVSAYKFTGLKLDTYEVMAHFENEWMKNVKKNIALPSIGKEYVYKLEQNKQGKYIFRFISEEPLEEVQLTKKEFKVIELRTTPPASPFTKTITTTEGTTIAAANESNENPVFILKDYKGSYGCPTPLNDTAFSEIRDGIASKTHEKEKLNTAKKLTKDNCLLTEQIKSVIALFDLDECRVEYARYAYSHTLDVDNYHSLSDSFKEEKSVDDLNDFLKSQQ